MLANAEELSRPCFLPLQSKEPNNAHTALSGMAGKNPPPEISRYLLVQAALGCALGAFFPFLLWATGTGSFGALLSGVDGATLVMVAVSSMMTFCPLVVATAIGLLSWREG